MICSICDKPIIVSKDGQGYGVDDKGNLVCYACCAVQDRDYMLKHGEITLYLIKDGDNWVIQNWPGTLVIPALRISEGMHNWARVQRHVWFRYEGHDWHGVQVGDYSEVCRCKRVS